MSVFMTRSYGHITMIFVVNIIDMDFGAKCFDEPRKGFLHSFFQIKE